MAKFTDLFMRYHNVFKDFDMDPGFIHQWHLFDANVIEAWQNYGYGSENVTIAVIERDIDIHHTDFKDKIVNAKDFDYQKRFTVVTKHLDGTETIVEQHFDTPFKLSDRKASHGTAVSSLAIANNDGKGVVGVAPNVRFMPIRIGGGDDQTWIDAFQYAVDNGADIISCSMGYSPFQEDNYPLSEQMKKALTELGDKAIFCFATGNAGKECIGFSSHPSVIGVGACTVLNKLASTSNTNPNTILTAPSSGDGMSIVASDVTGADGNNHSDIHYGFGGTSAATPILAGVIGLMLSQNPNLKRQQVKDILFKTGEKLVNDDRHVKINANRAIEMARQMA